MSILTIIDSTLSDNSAIGGASVQNAGGGIGGGIGSLGTIVDGVQLPQSLQLVNSTLVNNQAIGSSVVGGIYSSAGNAVGVHGPI